MENNVFIPEEGLGTEEVLKNIQEQAKEDPDFKKGRTWGLVYYAGEKHAKFLKDIHGQFSSQNALNPMAFKSLKNMERDVIRMTANLFNGGEQACGTMTSGGTESIMMAIKSYRDRARKLKPWILKPEIIAPASVHVAFDKACKYFDVKLIHAPLKDDFTVDTKWVKKKMNRNTILLVGSAPQYPHGVIDDIETLGELAQKKKIPLHVDACLGGFLLPFMEIAGYSVPRWDFRVPGVTSISADLHKYGFAHKGASTLTYRSMEYLKYQFFVYENWPGGIFASPAMLGTRSGGPIAAAWATMNAIGVNGYTKNAKTIMETTNRLMEGINSIDELEVIGEPQASVFAYGSKDSDVNIYAVADRLNEKGWHVDRNQSPESLHAMVTLGHEKFVDDFLEALKEAIAHVKENPELNKSGNAAMYGMIAKIPMRGMIKSQVHKMMQQMYSPEGELPEGVDEDDIMQKLGMQVIEIKENAEEVIENIKEKVATTIKQKLKF
jgi:sphinganine-1-phosphate aldolase